MNTKVIIVTLTSVLVTLCSAHSGQHHTPPGQVPQNFHDAGKNEGHIREHMQHEMNSQRPMSPQEMEFHYFRLHDTNNDTKLDGLEILQALSHMLPPNTLQPHETQGKSEQEVTLMRKERQELMFGNYVDIIDKVLRDDDKDGDGYLTYPEYVLARRRDEERMRQQHEELVRQGAVPPNVNPAVYQQQLQQQQHLQQQQLQQAQGYQQPPQGYQQPPQGYQQPPQGYQQPPQGYQQPPQGYQHPPQGYQQPPQGYQGPPGVPPQNYQQVPPPQK